MTKRVAADVTSSASKRRSTRNGISDQPLSDGSAHNGHRKKQILLNAFDMSTVGHLSPGQWKVLFASFEVFLVEDADGGDRTPRIVLPRSGV
jgi:hypothetical protein